jgi:hypothetical protein
MRRFYLFAAVARELYARLGIASADVVEAVAPASKKTS